MEKILKFKESSANKVPKRSASVIRIITFTVLVLYVVSLFIPLIWSAYSAFKSQTNYTDDRLGLPTKWIFNNFITAIQNFTVGVSGNGQSYTVFIEEMLLYSCLYSIGSAFMATFVCCLVAYVTARFNFKFSGVIYAIVVVTMTLPIVGSLPSELQVLKALGFYDNLVGLIILRGSFLGMYYLVFWGQFKTLPKDFANAAYIDGAGNWTVLFRIILPIVKNTFLTVMLIKFVEFWNDYTVNITYIPSFPTLAYGLYEFSFSAKPAISSAPMKLMACLILAVPIIIFFICFHKRLMGNISFGGLKE